MKIFSFKILLIASVIGITGCATSSSPSKPNSMIKSIESSSTNDLPIQKTNISQKFQFYKANLSVTQLIDSDAKYHSDKELELLLNEKLNNLLKKDNLLSTHIDANFLMIDAIYERRFIGDKTPIPSSSLSYPSYKYTIDVQNHTKSIAKVDKSKFSYKGNLSLTKRIIAKKLNNKTDEIQFINALANSIFEEIKNIHKKY